MVIAEIVARALDRLGDVCSADDDPETIAAEGWTLVFDAVKDAGFTAAEARAAADLHAA